MAYVYLFSSILQVTVNESAPGIHELSNVSYVYTLQSSKKKKKSPFKTRDDFKTDREYGQYIKATLKKGMKVRARSSYESVNQGDYGIYQQQNDATPPAQFTWEGLGGETYWVFWHMVDILPPLDKSEDPDRADKPG